MTADFFVDDATVTRVESAIVLQELKEEGNKMVEGRKKLIP